MFCLLFAIIEEVERWYLGYYNLRADNYISEYDVMLKI